MASIMAHATPFLRMRMATTISKIVPKPYVTTLASSRGISTLGRSPLLSATPLLSPASTTPSILALPTQHQQTRTALTKAKRHRREKIRERERRVARGLPAKPLPPKFISKDTPVMNALTRKERDAESASFDISAADEMKVKIGKTEEKNPIRFQFDGLVMSDRVKKLMDLKNGNQKEVVASQKRRGMELFQLREGDTGSSAVQVVALTTRIQQLQTHLAKHKKDHSGKRGLDALYVTRRKVLDYMERKDFESYRKVVKSLGLVR